MGLPDRIQLLPLGFPSIQPQSVISATNLPRDFPLGVRYLLSQSANYFSGSESHRTCTLTLKKYSGFHLSYGSVFERKLVALNFTIKFTLPIPGVRFNINHGIESLANSDEARLFDDEETLGDILFANDAKTAKALGRKVKNFDDDVWKENARRLVTEGNAAKFEQNPDLKQFLLETGDSVLVEASPYDRIWGIGLKATDEKAKPPETWQGQNLLGFALMDVREELA